VLIFQGGFTLSACIIADTQPSQRASICLRGAWIQRKKQPRTEAENRGDPAKVRRISCETTCPTSAAIRGFAPSSLSILCLLRLSSVSDPSVRSAGAGARSSDLIGQYPRIVKRETVYQQTANVAHWEREAAWKSGGRASVGCVLVTRGCSSPRRAPLPGHCSG
jgi:hypothetical protein